MERFKMEESIRIKEQDAERLSNLIYEQFKDIYPKVFSKDREAETMGKVLGVVTLIVRENGTEKFNSELMEMSRYYHCLMKELEYLDIYFRIANVTNSDPTKPLDLRGLKDILGDTL